MLDQNIVCLLSRRVIAKRLCRPKHGQVADRVNEQTFRRYRHLAVHRPKHTLKGKRDEAAQEKAKAELAVLKKTP